MLVDGKLVAYISGPMTGYEEYNYPEFMRLEKLLVDLDMVVINPAHTGVQEGWTWRQYLERDLIELLTHNVDIVVTLSDWEKSKGSSLEVHVAKELGIPVMTEKFFFDNKDNKDFPHIN